MSGGPSNDNGAAVGGRCPICGKPSNPAHRPFCSKRCGDVDLQRWLSGRYAIPLADDGGSSDASGDDGDER